MEGLEETAARLVRERELVLLGVMLADKARRTLSPQDWSTLGMAYEDLTSEGAEDMGRLRFLLHELGVEWDKSMGSPVEAIREHVLADARIGRAIGSASKMADFGRVGQLLDLADKRRTLEELSQFWREGKGYYEASDGRSTPQRKPKAGAT